MFIGLFVIAYCSVNLGQSASCYLVMFDVSRDIRIYLYGLLLARISIVWAQAYSFKKKLSWFMVPQYENSIIHDVPQEFTLWHFFW
jgi:hypothetical protein